MRGEGWPSASVLLWFLPIEHEHPASITTRTAAVQGMALVITKVYSKCARHSKIFENIYHTIDFELTLPRTSHASSAARTSDLRIEKRGGSSMGGSFYVQWKRSGARDTSFAKIAIFIDMLGTDWNKTCLTAHTRLP